MLTALRLVLLVGICLAGSGRLQATSVLSRQQQIEVLNRATRAFEQATAAATSDPQLARRRYQDAVALFQSLIDSGVRNGKLYYNLGNAYLRLGQIGRAILAYRRAQRFIPGDERLAENLRFARSLCKTRIRQRQESDLLRSLFFWHYTTRTRWRAVAALACYGLGWMLLLVRLRWPVPALRYGAGVALVVFLVLGSSVLVDEYRRAAVREGVIVRDGVVARKGDGESYEPRFKQPLAQGVEFTLLEARGSWLHIELPDGKDAWIPARAAEFL